MILQRRMTGLSALLAAAAVWGTGCTGPAASSVDASKAYIDARTAAFQAAEEEDPVVRAHAMEALGRTVGAEAAGVFMQGLGDPNPAVRFAAAMAVGNVGYRPAAEVLLRMAGDAETDNSVLCAVLYALHSVGNDTRTGTLGALLYDPDKWVRANAALAMGKMGEPSAKGPLLTRRGYELDPAVRLQIIESLAMLGDEQSAQFLEGYTKGPFLDMRLAAIPALGRLRTPRSGQVLRELLTDRHPPRVRVAAAGALAQRGEMSDQAFGMCVGAARNPGRVMRRAFRNRRITDIDVYSLQQIGAISLGWIYRPEAVNVLHPLLDSPDGSVRVAAAMSLLRLLSQYGPAAQPPPPPEAAPPQPTTAPAVAVPATTRPAAGKPPRPKLHTAGGKD